MLHHKQIKDSFSQPIMVMNKTAVMKRTVLPIQVVRLMGGGTLHPTKTGRVKSKWLGENLYTTKKGGR